MTLRNPGVRKVIESSGREFMEFMTTNISQRSLAGVARARKITITPTPGWTCRGHFRGKSEVARLTEEIDRRRSLRGRGSQEERREESSLSRTKRMRRMNRDLDEVGRGRSLVYGRALVVRGRESGGKRERTKEKPLKTETRGGAEQETRHERGEDNRGQARYTAQDASNFIRVHDATDDARDLAADNPPSAAPLRREDSVQDFVDDEPRKISPEELGMDISAEERERASARQDCIADQMWKDYLACLAERGEEPQGELVI
ncbi:hypothetical protein K438DRAFT_2049051 [Mycena galopus ATCC 62051]|nr:hypothetical protein K438DRAFT_2049051 [Mycena galopus ATCC 62051]